MFVGVIDTNLDLSVPALLEGFEMRESISFIEEHINRQVRLLHSASAQTGAATTITCWKRIHSFSFFKVSMIESLRMLCLLSITENGELTSYN